MPFPVFVVLEFEQLDRYKMEKGRGQMAFTGPRVATLTTQRKSEHLLTIIVIMVVRVAQWASWDVAAVAEI